MGRHISRWMTALLVLAPVLFAQEAPPAEAPAEAPAPIIFCPQPTFDFGSAQSGQIITHEYVVQNKGNADLTIGQVRPSCGCTLASLSTQSVPPGAEARITAQLNLAGRTGLQHKTLTVDSNDPKQPQLTLLLSGSVVEVIAVRPAQLIFGQLNHTSDVSGEIVLTAGTGQLFKVTGAELAMPVFQAEVITNEEGKAYAVKLRSKPPMAPGNYQAMLRVSTDSPVRPMVEALVAANVVGDLMLAPTEITLAEQRGQKATRFIVLRSANGQPFPQPEVVTPLPEIAAQIFPFGTNGYRIQLSNLPAERDMNGKSVVVRTAVESMREIAVPIRVVPAPL